MSIQKIAAMTAHEAVSKVISSGDIGEETATASFEALGIEVTVTIRSKPGAAPVTVSADEPTSFVLKTIHESILAAAPSAGKKPMTMKKVIKDAGYSYSDHSRTAVDELVVHGYLVKTTRGVKRLPK